jgi:DNA polymerase alpha subunit A
MQSSIGRLRRKQLPRLASGSSGQDTFVGVLAAGRLVCDTFLSSRELLRETTYTLTNLANTQLSVDRREVDPLEVPRFFASSQSVIALCRHTENDAQLAMQLMFKLQVCFVLEQPRAHWLTV